jgi:hypothetical protein
MILYLFFAIIWFVLGIVLLFFPDLLPTGNFNRHLLGGLALVLGCYNLVRLWWWYSTQGGGGAGPEAYQRPPVRRAGDEQPPNPDFDFTSPPRPRPHDQPPSPN